MKFKKILFNFLIEKSFYLAEEFMTTDSQLVNCEWMNEWMNKDKLRLDVSWLWFVLWLCFMCHIKSMFDVS